MLHGAVAQYLFEAKNANIHFAGLLESEEKLRPDARKQWEQSLVDMGYTPDQARAVVGRYGVDIAQEWKRPVF